MAKSSGIQNPCDCGFDPDGMEYCLEGLIISDMFRKEIIVDCNCICHGSVIALRPVAPPKVIPCRQCQMTGFHKMDCTQEFWDAEAQRELVAA